MNNNAAALVLAATVLAQGREIVISRGEMVEIGDGFRLPALLASTGARLREVGTTNRTTAGRLRRGGRTGHRLRAQGASRPTSGSRGSPRRRPYAELAGLGVPVVVDIGSGLLAPEPLLPDEPDAATVLAEGADLVTASGDKLLGGPQAGLLLGRSDAGRTPAAASPRPRAARRQAHARRAGGHPSRARAAGRPGPARRRRRASRPRRASGPGAGRPRRRRGRLDRPGRRRGSARRRAAERGRRPARGMRRAAAPSPGSSATSRRAACSWTCARFRRTST